MIPSATLQHWARCCPEQLTEHDANLGYTKKVVAASIAGKVAVASPMAESMALQVARANAPHIKDFALSLALFCTADSRPFEMVEGDAFRVLIKEIRPDLLVPSADTVKRRAVVIEDVAHE